MVFGSSKAPSELGLLLRTRRAAARHNGPGAPIGTTSPAEAGDMPTAAEGLGSFLRLEQKHLGDLDRLGDV